MRITVDAGKKIESKIDILIVKKIDGEIDRKIGLDSVR